MHYVHVYMYSKIHVLSTIYCTCTIHVHVHCTCTCIFLLSLQEEPAADYPVMSWGVKEAREYQEQHNLYTCIINCIKSLHSMREIKNRERERERE